jgi:hypothetical protein
VRELAFDGESRFHATLVAEIANVSVADARHALLELAAQGDLIANYEVTCPDNGRTVKTYHSLEDVPFGEEVHSDLCDDPEPFLLEQRDVWVSFSPSRELLQRVLRDGPSRSRKKKLARATLFLRKIASIPTSRTKGQRSTSSRTWSM